MFFCFFSSDFVTTSARDELFRTLVKITKTKNTTIKPLIT